MDFLRTLWADCNDLIYIGAESGNLSVISIPERTLKPYTAINWKTLFPHAQKLLQDNPVTSIKVNKRKPYRILIAFKYTGAIIWNIKVKN